jgi:hypothetical protein
MRLMPLTSPLSFMHPRQRAARGLAVVHRDPASCRRCSKPGRRMAASHTSTLHRICMHRLILYACMCECKPGNMAACSTSQLHVMYFFPWGKRASSWCLQNGARASPALLRRSLQSGPPDSGPCLGTPVHARRGAPPPRPHPCPDPPAQDTPLWGALAKQASSHAGLCRSSSLSCSKLHGSSSARLDAGSPEHDSAPGGEPAGQAGPQAPGAPFHRCVRVERRCTLAAGMQGAH